DRAFEPGAAALQVLRVAEALEEHADVAYLELEIERGARRLALLPQAGAGKRRIRIGHRQLVDAPVLALVASLDFDATELAATMHEIIGDDVDCRQVLQRRGRARVLAGQSRPYHRGVLGKGKARHARDQPAIAFRDR